MPFGDSAEFANSGGSVATHDASFNMNQGLADPSPVSSPSGSSLFHQSISGQSMSSPSVNSAMLRPYQPPANIPQLSTPPPRDHSEKEARNGSPTGPAMPRAMSPAGFLNTIPVPMPPSIDLSKVFLRQLLNGVLWFGGWAALDKIVQVLGTKYSPGYSAMSNKLQVRANSFILSFVHAVAISGISTYFLARGPRAKVRHIIAMLEVMQGYFLNDFWASRSLWMVQKADVFHHILAIMIIPSVQHVVNRAPEIAYFVPGYSVVELSTIFLDILWLMRALKMTNNPIFRMCAPAFIISFFLLRFFWMPYFTYNLRYSHERHLTKLGIFRYAIYAANVLQWYWGGLLVKRLLGMKKQ